MLRFEFSVGEGNGPSLDGADLSVYERRMLAILVPADSSTLISFSSIVKDAL